MKRKFSIWDVVTAVTLVVGLMALTAGAALNFVSDEGTVAYSNSTGAAIASGAVVDLGSRYGIAGVDIATNATGTVLTEGIWDVPLTTNQTAVVDQKLYWVAAHGQASTNAVTQTYLGLCTKAVTSATNAAGRVHVDLNAAVRGAIVTAVTDVTSTNATLVKTTATIGH